MAFTSRGCEQFGRYAPLDLQKPLNPRSAVYVAI